MKLTLILLLSLLKCGDLSVSEEEFKGINKF